MLSNTITIIVPSAMGTEAAGPDLIAHNVRLALTALSTVAGGATAEVGLGAWIDKGTGDLVTEKVTSVYAMCTDAQVEALADAAHDVTRTIKATMRQEAVSVVINGSMYFV